MNIGKADLSANVNQGTEKGNQNSYNSQCWKQGHNLLTPLQSSSEVHNKLMINFIVLNTVTLNIITEIPKCNE